MLRGKEERGETGWLRRDGAAGWRNRVCWRKTALLHGELLLLLWCLLEAGIDGLPSLLLFVVFAAGAGSELRVQPCVEKELETAAL